MPLATPHLGRHSSKSDGGSPLPPASFELAEFQEPSAWFWPGYFWIWNDVLTEDRLLSQLEDMYAHGARSVCMLTEPREFQPNNMGTHTSPDYLSDAFMALVRRVVEECDRLGMNYWFYDEGGWPSGCVCGRIYYQNPEQYRRRMVQAQSHELEAGGCFVVPELALCAAFERDLVTTFQPGDTMTAGTVAETVRVCAVAFEDVAPDYRAPLTDILAAGANEKFIELTHETYRKSVGTHFGNAIRFAFTDEPSVPATVLTGATPCLTWTADMAAAFEAKTGYALVPHLPALLSAPTDDEAVEQTRVRLDFYDVWSQLIVERYLEPIRTWCRSQGLLSAGHFGGDDEPAGNAQHGFGHILRALRALDLPGVDTILRQTFPGLRSHQFTKYASSVARQNGLPYVLSESFAVFGNGLTPAQMRWITDQQYVRGANLTVAACYPYSTHDNLMPGERPHFGGVNPLWDYLDIYHAYTARLGYLLSLGRAVCTIAVYFDIRGIWAGAGHQTRSLQLHDDIADALLQAQCDFDYVDDDVLTTSRIEANHLVIGEMRYDTLIIPETRWMTATAMTAVERFADAGGRVIKTATAQLPGDIVPVATLREPCAEIRMTKRQWDTGCCYFITSESETALDVLMRLDEDGQVFECDLEGGRFVGASRTSTGEVEISLPPWSSTVLLIGDADIAVGGRPTYKRETATSTLTISDGWTLRPRRYFQAGEHDFACHESSQTAVPAKLGDWGDVLGENFSGDGEYRVGFDIVAADVGRAARIDLGDVRYACEVQLNGACIGRRIWAPFAFDITGRLKAGRNELAVTVTNTLANALLDDAVTSRWDANEGPGWSKGHDTYDHPAREFERDSVSSGLYGPVVVYTD
jgi:hypothetical protein